MTPGVDRPDGRSAEAGADDLIDEYVDDLLSRLRGPGHRVRRIVVESEAHLRDAADAFEAGGLDNLAAQEAALERFGPAGQVAAAANRALGAASSTQLVTATGWLAARLTGIGLVAVGLSGLLSTALAAIAGRSFVFGAPKGVSFPAFACEHWLSAQPSAATCSQAGTLENAADTLGLRLAAGAVGVLLLVGLLVLRRIGRRPVDVLPAGLAATLAGTVFGCAAVVLFSLGVSDTAVSLMFGQGQWYVDAVISLVVSAGCFASLLRHLRSAAPAT